MANEFKVKPKDITAQLADLHNIVSIHCSDVKRAKPNSRYNTAQEYQEMYSPTSRRSSCLSVLTPWIVRDCGGLSKANIRKNIINKRGKAKPIISGKRTSYS